MGWKSTADALERRCKGLLSRISVVEPKREFNSDVAVAKANIEEV